MLFRSCLIVSESDMAFSVAEVIKINSRPICSKVFIKRERLINISRMSTTVNLFLF